MRIKRKPLPSPWTADAAVLHLYLVWTNRGRIQLRLIALPNQAMVSSILNLWQASGSHGEEVGGMITKGKAWRLYVAPDGTGTLEFSTLQDN